MTDSVKFKVNGTEYSVGSDVGSDVMLVDYLRNYLDLRGTKFMCREGACGSCMVNAVTSPGTKAIALNSCLVAVTSCHNWEITTIEGVGCKRLGYHIIQKSLAENHGTQCGYCSPGWIMSMYSFLENNENPTMLEIEKSMNSNQCRCTGYRPIIKCFKNFAKDAPAEDRITDIENLAICKKNGKSCRKTSCDEDGWCVVNDSGYSKDSMKTITLKDGKVWYRPTTIEEILSLLETKISGDDYMLVAGNTAKGVYPLDDYPSVLIDIGQIKTLKMNDLDQNLVVGAGLTLTEFMDVLKAQSSISNFKYLEKLHEHMLVVAHTSVRNVGTIAGNLMLKHKHNTVPSDIFLLFETIGAQVTIMDWNGKTETHDMQGFLKISMTGKLIYNVLLPPLNDDEYKLVSYKIMPRSHSAYAIVNAGFLYKVNNDNTVQEARIVYGGLSVKFLRATATENYLVGKQLFSNTTLQAALKVLDGELIVEESPPKSSAKYRKHLAKALFFKGLLTLCPSSSRSTRCETGTVNLHESRGVSEAKQTYGTDPTLWPLNQPTEKLEGLTQCSGEVAYTDDIPAIRNECFAAFVLSTVAVGTILKIDASEALKLKGVIACYTAKDIPGLNSFTPADSDFYSTNEELLADGTVKYYDQPLAIIVAETQNLANRAAKLVKVKYSNVTTPVVDIKKAITDSSRTTLYTSVDATNVGTDVHKVVTGHNTFYGQYHYSMETLVAVTIPNGDGLEVYSSTQWLDGTHIMVSRALNIDQNKIDVHVGRVGGAYGMKISRSILSAVACGLVSTKLHRPCRIIQPLTTNMRALGKRAPTHIDYEVAVNSSGVIQYVDYTIYGDNGYLINETLAAFSADSYNNCYDSTKINFKYYNTLTDTAKNTWCRSPGTLEVIAASENIMERISYELSLDPVAVRLANLNTDYSVVETMIETLKKDAEYVTRRAAVDSFNTQNRWKKRGLRFAIARWPTLGAQRLDMNISIYHGDGTIAVTHGGIEMGQGINTKAVQLVAYLLNVPVSYVTVKNSNTINAPNSFISGGSLTTASIIIGLKRCCDEILTRLEPIKATLTNPTWKELVQAAFSNDVDLQAHGFASNADTQTYNVFGVALSEVEIDCLTGECVAKRIDILQDVGLSVSPDIDIGQVEGAFVMGLGYWTCEKLVYDPDTGKNLTDRTWEYFIPEATDIPEVFNVYLDKKSYSNKMILGSKGTGEPAICSSVGVTFAIREAITMARQDAGIPTTEWFSIDGPYNPEAICMATETNTEDFKF